MNIKTICTMIKYIKYIEEYNPGRKCNVLIVFDDTIAVNKITNQIVSELLVRRRKLNISPIFSTQFYFPIPKYVRVNCTYFVIMKSQTNENLNKSPLIIHQILTLKSS